MKEEPFTPEGRQPKAKMRCGKALLLHGLHVVNYHLRLAVIIMPSQIIGFN